MSMTPRVRRFALTSHVAFSVGWLGAVATYLALAATGLNSPDPQRARAAYLAMELIGWLVIVPCALTALLTGLVQSLGSEWGLFRHYWIVTKFVLTLGATTVLLLHMPAVLQMAGIAAERTLSRGDFGTLRVQLVLHAAGGLAVLFAITTLSIFKPWGLTAYGRRKQQEQTEDAAVRPSDVAVATGTSWGVYFLLGLIGLLVLFVVLHLAGVRPGH